MRKQLKLCACFFVFLTVASTLAQFTRYVFEPLEGPEGYSSATAIAKMNGYYVISGSAAFQGSNKTWIWGLRVNPRKSNPRLNTWREYAGHRGWFSDICAEANDFFSVGRIISAREETSGFFYHRRVGAGSFPQPIPGNRGDYAATSCNASRQSVGWVYEVDLQRVHAWRHTLGGAYSFLRSGDLDASGTDLSLEVYPLGLDDNSRVAVGTYHRSIYLPDRIGGWAACIWRDLEAEDLQGTLEALSSEAFDVKTDTTHGEVIVGTLRRDWLSSSTPVCWINGQLRSITPSEGRAFSVNQQGTVVGWVGGRAFVMHLDRGQVTPAIFLDTLAQTNGYQLITARGVSSDGLIVGDAMRNGRTSAYVLIPYRVYDSWPSVDQAPGPMPIQP